MNKTPLAATAAPVDLPETWPASFPDMHRADVLQLLPVGTYRYLYRSGNETVVDAHVRVTADCGGFGFMHGLTPAAARRMARLLVLAADAAEAFPVVDKGDAA